MNHRKIFRKSIMIVLIFALVLETASCGFFMYPERRNQAKGEVDVGVAALDAIGLVFFIIPGLIAFAVDFSANTIYLPSGKKSAGLSSDEKFYAVQVSTDKMNKSGIEAIIKGHTGLEVDLYSKKVQAYQLENIDQAKAIRSNHS
jgi:hypothetical protein